MTARVPLAVSDYMAKIGAIGGAKGHGAKKKRTAAHYKKLVEIRRRNKARRET